MRILDLGPLSVETVGVTRPLTGRRLTALLAALLVRPGQVVATDYLIDAIWGEHAPDRAPAALDTLVWRLRRQLEPARASNSPWTVLTHTESQGYRLDLPDAEVDSRAFSAFAERVSRSQMSATERLDGATAALRLWRGQPYEGVPEGDRIDVIRAQLSGQRLTVQLAQLDALLELDEPERAVSEAIGMLTDDPYSEPLWARRILGLRRAGRSTAAAACYAECAQLLESHLGIRPGPQVRAAREADPMAPSPIPVPRRPAEGIFRVPMPRTALIGRQLDIGATGELLRRHRQVTLVGPVGSGKTRLAIAMAQRLRAGYPHGVYFVDLSGVVDGVLAADRVQQSLQLPDARSGHASQVVRDFLADRTVLLIVDNCEQVVAAVGRLVESLLAGCPSVTILATSRQPLGLAGEIVRPVRPLPLPAGSAVADLTASPAAALLADRLGDRTAFASLTEEERAAVGRICAATDGLPLSLELAAALAPVLQLHEIADHLASNPMALRTIGHATHQLPGETNLRDAIDWSHRMLSEDERAVHRRLAVLPPEFSLDAAMAVCADSIVTAERVPPALAGLAYRSLLDALGPDRPGGPSRFHQLVPMRAHATEQLASSGEASDVGERRTRWARELLLSGPRHGRPGQATFYQKITDNHRTIADGLSAAVVHTPCDDDVFAVARLLPYWIDRMIPADPLRISAAVSSGVTRANGPLAREAATVVRGSVLAANQRATEAHDDLAQAVARIGRVGFDQADPARWVQIADLLIVAAMCCWIGDDFALATMIAGAVAKYADRLDDADLRLCADTFHGLSLLGTDPAAATATSTELSAQCEAVGNDLAALMASVTCSIAALLVGDGDGGLHWTSVALRLQRTLGVLSIADTLETRGNHYVAAGRAVEAVRCYAAAHTLQHRLGRSWPHHQATHRRLAVARERLSPNEYDGAWADGERIAKADLVEDWL